MAETASKHLPFLNNLKPNNEYLLGTKKKKKECIFTIYVKQFFIRAKWVFYSHLLSFTPICVSIWNGWGLNWKWVVLKPLGFNKQLEDVHWFLWTPKKLWSEILWEQKLQCIALQFLSNLAQAYIGTRGWISWILEVKGHGNYILWGHSMIGRPHFSLFPISSLFIFDKKLTPMHLTSSVIQTKLAPEPLK